jgi:predicted DNA-binding protein (UPF0251 family)
MGNFIVPNEDIELISELLETLSREEVAEKWEVSAGTLARYLNRNGTSIPKIKVAYNVRIFHKMKKTKERTEDIALFLGVSRAHLAKQVRDARKQKQINKEGV